MTLVCSWPQLTKSARAKEDLHILDDHSTITRVPRPEPNSHDVDGACLWTSVIQKVGKRFPNLDPNVTAEKWLEQLQLESNGVRFEARWHKIYNVTPAFIRVVQGPVPRRNSVEWSDCRRKTQERSTPSCYIFAAHPQQIKAVLDQTSWQPRKVLYVHQVAYRHS